MRYALLPHRQADQSLCGQAALWLRGMDVLGGVTVHVRSPACAAALGLCDAGRLAQARRGLRDAEPFQALLWARPDAVSVHNALEKQPPLVAVQAVLAVQPEGARAADTDGDPLPGRRALQPGIAGGGAGAADRSSGGREGGG